MVGLQSKKSKELFRELGFPEDGPPGLNMSEINLLLVPHIIQFQEQGNIIPLRQNDSAAATRCAASFCDRGNRAELLWHPHNSSGLIWPEDRDKITGILAWIIAWKVYRDWCAQRRGPRTAAAPKSRLESKSQKCSKGKSNAKNSRVIASLVEDIISQEINPLVPWMSGGGGSSDLSSNWLRDTHVPWPKPAALKLRFQLHAANFYYDREFLESQAALDELRVSVIDPLRQGTEIERFTDIADWQRLEVRVKEETIAVTKDLLGRGLLHWKDSRIRKTDAFAVAWDAGSRRPFRKATLKRTKSCADYLDESSDDSFMGDSQNTSKSHSASKRPRKSNRCLDDFTTVFSENIQDGYDGSLLGNLLNESRLDSRAVFQELVPFLQKYIDKSASWDKNATQSMVEKATYKFLESWKEGENLPPPLVVSIRKELENYAGWWMEASKGAPRLSSGTQEVGIQRIKKPELSLAENTSHQLQELPVDHGKRFNPCYLGTRHCRFERKDFPWMNATLLSKPCWHKCVYCGKKFSNRANMKNHINKHPIHKAQNVNFVNQPGEEQEEFAGSVPILNSVLPLKEKRNLKFLPGGAGGGGRYVDRNEGESETDTPSARILHEPSGSNKASKNQPPAQTSPSITLFGAELPPELLPPKLVDRRLHNLNPFTRAQSMPPGLSVLTNPGLMMQPPHPVPPKSFGLSIQSETPPSSSSGGSLPISSQPSSGQNHRPSLNTHDSLHLLVMAVERPDGRILFDLSCAIPASYLKKSLEEFFTVYSQKSASDLNRLTKLTVNFEFAPLNQVELVRGNNRSWEDFKDKVDSLIKRWRERGRTNFKSVVGTPEAGQWF